MDLNFARPVVEELSKELFVADMHFHTTYSHDCTTSVKEIIERAKKLGIYVAFTDHNKIGGVIEARRFKDAPVIPGIELCSEEGKEVIAYFYDDKELEAFFNRYIKPGLKEKNALQSTRTPYSMNQLLIWLRQYECILHIPHPFGPQPRKSFLFFDQHPELFDAIDSIEVLNPNLRRRSNLAALGWATTLKKKVAAGSDGHRLQWLGTVVTTSKASSVREHLDNVKRGAVSIYGLEMTPTEIAFNYANTTIKNKVSRGVSGALHDTLSLPGKAFKSR